METTELLQKVKDKTGAESDYKLAKVLDIPTQRIADYRSGKRAPDVYACTKIAIMLGVDPLEIISEVEARSAQTQAKRDFWRDFRQHTGKAAVMVLALGFMTSSPVDVHASQLTDNPIMRSVEMGLCLNL